LSAFTFPLPGLDLLSLQLVQLCFTPCATTLQPALGLDIKSLQVLVLELQSKFLLLLCKQFLIPKTCHLEVGQVRLGRYQQTLISLDAIAIFFNSLGGALSISIAQNVFTNTLTQEIIKKAPGISASKIITAGATRVREVTPAASLQLVLEAYTLAINKAFILPIVTGAIAFLCSLFVSVPLDFHRHC
jgi:hypothetical protein